MHRAQIMATADMIRENPEWTASCECEEDLGLAAMMKVFEELLRTNFPLSGFLRAVRYSEYGPDLLDHVFNTGDWVGETKLTPVMEQFAHDITHDTGWGDSTNAGPHDRLITQYIAQKYWQSRFEYFFAQADFRRAWDEIRKSYRGFIPPAQNIKSKTHEGEPVEQGELALDARIVEDHILYLHNHMFTAGAFIFDPPLLEASFVQLRAESFSERKVTASVPGIAFARAMKEGPRGAHVSHCVLHLAAHFAVERQKKRQANRSSAT